MSGRRLQMRVTPQSKLLPWEKPYQVRICVLRCELGVLILLNSPRQCFVHALNGLALPTARHARQIALTGSRRLRSTLAAVPALFAHAVVTVATITNMHHALSIRPCGTSLRAGSLAPLGAFFCSHVTALGIRFCSMLAIAMT